jgi:hypothetical protein
MFGDGQFISATPDFSRVIQVSRDAWRYLGWLVPDEAGALIRLPAQTFGPLPEYDG